MIQKREWLERPEFSQKGLYYFKGNPNLYFKGKKGKILPPKEKKDWKAQFSHTT